MKLVVYGGFVFLGGCILLGAHSISYVIGGIRPIISNDLGITVMVIGGLLGMIGIGSRFNKNKKDE